MEGDGTGEEGCMVEPLMARAGEGVAGVVGVGESVDVLSGGGSNMNSVGS